MKKRLIIAGMLLPVFCLISGGASLGSDANRHVEDFTTTQYKDVVNTTAWWDTVGRELKLFPFMPAIVGNCDTPGIATDVVISGDYAFVADGASGLRVIDISDSTSPTLAGFYDTPDLAFDVALSGNHAIVADGTSGLLVIDISDPTSPTLLGTRDTFSSARGVAISGDHAFVADGSSGLHTIDISDPDNPTIVGTYNTQGFALDVAVSGDYVFVADEASGLKVINISDPTAPTLAGSCATSGDARVIAVSGDYAFVAAEGSGLLVIDISDPTNPTLAGTCDTPGTARSVVVSGDRAFIADEGAGLQVIDISDPTSPTLKGSYDTDGAAWGAAIEGNHAFVADGSSGLQVIAISDPISPMIAGTCDTPDLAYDVAVSGDYAFAADYGSGIQVVDISDPKSPTIVGTCDTPGSSMGIAISGNHAFAADYTSGLQVIDISDPTDPSLAGTFNTPSAARGVAVSGNYAYVADYTSGLQVIDISDPTNPFFAGSCSTSVAAFDVAVAGDHAFVADYTSGLQVIDISDPTNPVIVGSYDTPGTALGVTVSGSHVFLADVDALLVIDISDPTNPSLTGNCNTPGASWSVTVSGDYAFVANESAGLQVIDITDLVHPTLVETCDTPNQARSVAVSGDYAYAADGSTGLEVIQVFQSEVDQHNNVGRSIAVDASNDTIFGARLTTTQTHEITWEMSADDGAHWQGMTPDGNWNQLSVPGIDLVWRSTHAWAEPGVNPTVSQLEIDWLVDAAPIDSIVDVRNDQGGWVRVHFRRSGRDFADGITLPIENYGIWRRVDISTLVAALEVHAFSTEEVRASDCGLDLGDIPIVAYQEKIYVYSVTSLAASSFPPGIWEFLTSVPAIQQDAYIAALPTLADSSSSGTNHAIFLITAHTTTPSIWYVSEPDSGYSVDNIAPGVPEGLMVAYNTGSGNQLTWDPSPETDFQYYRVYRGDSEDFTPGPGNLVHETATEAWADPEYDGWGLYYKVTALDHVGNESEPASPATVTSEETPSTPKAFALHQNVPNPFNPVTAIRFDLPRPAHVTLTIYSVKGELVATLADGPMTEGQKELSWMGRDDGGRSVASGVYFYRLTAGDFVQTRKMVLLR
jgi:hypothetical protein